MTSILKLERVGRRFGGVNALDDVDLTLGEGEIVGLIGPNGAGKTTLVNVVTGVHRPSMGNIHFEGKRIDRLRPDQIARLGIARTFQVVQPFPRMSVLENVSAAAMFSGGARTLSAAHEQAFESLAFCRLEHRANSLAASLSLADRKRLELAKSLAMQPRLLFLDEVNAGLNQSEIDLALTLIQSIAARGITVVLIEHLMKVVLNASHRIVVLHNGSLIADGKPQDVVRDSHVVQAYLGKRYAASQGDLTQAII